jgi:hypothetical protein
VRRGCPRVRSTAGLADSAGIRASGRRRLAAEDAEGEGLILGAHLVPSISDAARLNGSGQESFRRGLTQPRDTKHRRGKCDPHGPDV